MAASKKRVKNTQAVSPGERRVRKVSTEKSRDAARRRAKVAELDALLDKSIEELKQRVGTAAEARPRPLTLDDLNTAYDAVEAETGGRFIRRNEPLPEDDPAVIPFDSPSDLHREVAAEMFGVPISEVTDEQREIAKNPTGREYRQIDPGRGQNDVAMAPTTDADRGPIVNAIQCSICSRLHSLNAETYLTFGPIHAGEDDQEITDRVVRTCNDAGSAPARCLIDFMEQIRTSAAKIAARVIPPPVSATVTV